MKPEGASKVARLRLSVGADDDRDMAAFVADIREALTAANVKNITSLGEEYIIDGQVVRPEDVHTEADEDPEPEPQSTADETTPEPQDEGVQVATMSPSDLADQELGSSDESIADDHPEIAAIVPDQEAQENAEKARALASKVSKDLKSGRVSMRKKGEG